MRKVRKKWTQDSLIAALAVIKSGTSVFSASKTYQIPEATLR